jgi:hypothetical protein
MARPTLEEYYKQVEVRTREGYEFNRAMSYALFDVRRDLWTIHEGEGGFNPYCNSARIPAFKLWLEENWDADA